MIFLREVGLRIHIHELESTMSNVANLQRRAFEQGLAGMFAN